MKTNWKIALMCLATIAMVACKGGTNKPDDPTDDPNSDYVSPIKINDLSVADWDALDQSKIAKAVLPDKPLYSGLKMIKVYADEVCINYLLLIDPAQYTSHTPSDAMHIYMDADNSDETGGYWDQFDAPDKGNTDLMFEGPIWDDYGNQMSYVPTVSFWNGKLNGEGWLWAEQATSNKIGGSQFIGDSIIEGRLLIDLIPFKFAEDAFSIGFDIQQNWESAGLLPQGNTPDGTLIGRSKKLLVTFDKAAK